MAGNDQQVNNAAPVATQLNITEHTGIINVGIGNGSRLAQRFKRLKEEVEKDIRYEGFIEDFKRYHTELDGRSMPAKLADGGFNQLEIDRATIRKHQYTKKLERNRFYETAQLIDLELFAFITLNFETHVEPLIESERPKREIKQCVLDKIINPIYELINKDGQDDTLLNYNIDHLYGMVFFLTGKCHLNWVKYDSLQPGV